MPPRRGRGGYKGRTAAPTSTVATRDETSDIAAQTVNSTTSQSPTPVAAASSPRPAPFRSAAAAIERGCYCGDKTKFATDLICSALTTDCYATHVACIKHSDGTPFANWIKGQSVFQCANCVNKRGFKHPAMTRLLTSKFGNMYQHNNVEQGADSNGATVPSSDAAIKEESLSASPTPSSSSVDTRKVRRGIRDSDKRGRLRAVPRCTSPSHFITDDTNTTAAAMNEAAIKQANKQRADALFNAVSHLYYRPALPAQTNTTGNDDTTSASTVWVSAEYDRTEYPTIDLLMSPLRAPSVLDDWTPIEIAKFEAGICSFGKDFHLISSLIETKTTGKCVEFYYLWKKSGHYAMWKDFGKPTRKMTAAKEDQWRKVNAKMAQTNNKTQTNTAATSLVALDNKPLINTTTTSTTDATSSTSTPQLIADDSTVTTLLAKRKREDDGDVGDKKRAQIETQTETANDVITTTIADHSAMDFSGEISEPTPLLHGNTAIE